MKYILTIGLYFRFSAALLFRMSPPMGPIRMHLMI